MTIQTDVTVICVTFNSVGCMATLAGDLRQFANIIIVDNASTDETVSVARKLLPAAQILVNRRNVGFGAANNRALAVTRTRWALLLNPDCRIDDSALQELLKAGTEFPNASLIAPQAIRDDGSPQESYGPAFFEPQPRQYQMADGTVSARWLSGCCLLLRTAHFTGIRAFDERFFLYYEDDDLALEVHRRCHECLLVPSAVARHVGNGSSDASIRTQLRKDFHYQRSKRLIIRKYCGPLAAFAHGAKLFVAGPFAVLLYSVVGKRKYVIRWIGWFGSVFVRVWQTPAVHRPENSDY